jgi:hypothetical protein
MEPFTFINYDRISDTILWLGPNVTLKFVVNLFRQNRNEDEIRFHSEYKYNSKKLGRTAYSITRTYDFYFVINFSDFNLKGATMHTSDVLILNMLIKNNIMPWFMGPTRIFDMVENGEKMTITGKYQDVMLPLSEATYIKFSPVVIYYENTNDYKEGIRFEINSKETFVDVPVDRFLEFAYIMKNTDMVTYASTMLAYVKSGPYQINMRSSSDFKSDSNLNTINSNIYGKKKGNFFDK